MWSSSQVTISLIILYTSVATAILSSPSAQISPQNPNNAQLSVHNTTLGQVLPTAFTVTAGVVPGADMPKANCLLQTLVAIGQLATEDFNGRQPSITYVHSLFTLYLEGHRRGAGIDRKYAVWGFYGAISYMLSHDDFRTRLFTLRWQGSIVGRIVYSQRTLVHTGGENNTQDESEAWSKEPNIPSLQAPTTTSQNTTTLTTHFVDSTLEYIIHIQGHLIPEPFIYMTNATALVQAAPLPSAETISVFDVDASDYNAHLRLSDPNDPPRSSPPLLRKGDLIKMLIQIPAVMLVEGNRWGEADLRIRLDNVIVATGALTWVGAGGGVVERGVGGESS